MKTSFYTLRRLIVPGAFCFLSLCSLRAQAQTIYTIGGNGTAGYSGDGGAATSANLNSPYGVALDASGNLYYADYDTHVVRKIDANTNIISTVAGTGTSGSTGDGSAATAAKLNQPIGLAFDNSGNLYITERTGNRVRKVTTAGIISTIAGTGTAGSTGDGAAATAAKLNGPSGILVDASGNIYITETDGNRVRKINTSGVISTIAGTGTASSTGDGAAATAATLDGPTEMAFDAAGDLYISETAGHRVRKITFSSGNISTVVGTGSSGSTGDGGAATAAKVKQPSGIAFDETGNLYIIESNGRYIRKVNTSGIITTIAGTGTAGYSGDGGDPMLAQFRRPYDLAYRAGNLYLSDFNANVIRMICNPQAPVVSAATVHLCKDATASPLSATGTKLLWYTAATGGTGSSMAPTPVTTATGSTTYYVSQTSFDPACESPRTAITVEVHNLSAAPTVGSSPIEYCKNSTAAALTATGTSLRWYTVATGGTGSSTAPTPSTTAAGSTTYYVTQTESTAFGCASVRVPLTVKINDLPAAPAVSTPVNYCKDATATTLSATGTSLKWYTAATGGTGSTTAPTPSTTTAGTINYYVSQTSAASAGSCEGPRATIAVITNNPPAAPSVTSLVNLCQDGPSTALTATGTNLKWYSAATGGTGSTTAPTPTTTTAGTTTYYVSQSLAATSAGCEGPRASISVVVNSLPAAPTVTTPVNLCKDGATSSLTATGTNLKWYSAATGGTGSTTPPTPSTSSVSSTDYFVSQTSAASSGSCESNTRSKITVNVQPNPVVAINSKSPSGFIFCPGKNITLKATAPTAISYQWETDGSDVPGATSDTLVVNTTGISGVEVKDIYGCKGTAEVYVQEDTSVHPTLTPDFTAICAGASVLMTCSPGFTSYTFDWIKDGLYIIPATPKAHTKSINEAGMYKVIVTNNFGCIDTTAIAVVTMHPAPVKPLITNTDPILYITGSYIYRQWYRNGTQIIGANASSYKVTSNGKYHVEVTDVNGCTVNSDTITINKTSDIHESFTGNNIRIYPNPTRNRIMIEAPFSVNAIVKDLLGRTVKTEQATHTIDLENLPDGTYILQVLDEQNQLISIEKIMKKSE